jgi:hypothetical protein
MDPTVMAAGTALIGAMVSDGWQHTRSAVVAWLRTARPEQAYSVGEDLEVARSQVLAARERGDADTEQALTGAWRLQLQQMVDEDPALVPALQRLLKDYLTPALPGADQSRIQQIIDAQAQDQARQYIAGRDQHINEA